MTIADRTIPIANGHAPSVVITNASYIFVAVVLMWAVPSVTSGLAAVALVVQAIGSTLFHGTSDDARWAQLMDAVGIQWVLAVMMGTVAAEVVGVPHWQIAAPVAALAWPLWWRYAHHVTQRRAIGLQALIAVGGLWYAAGLWPALGVLCVFLLAVLAWQSGRTHGLLHALWHPGAGVAQGLFFYFML